MSEIDWSKAPEGATHATPGGRKHHSAFWRIVQGIATDAWVVLPDGDFNHVILPALFNRDRKKLVERPSSPTWNGEGIPPVGIDCEYMKRGGAEWFYCTVIAHHDGGAVVAVHEDDLSYSYWNDSGHFRPIRTPEQIAAEDREKAVEEMHDLVGDIEKIPTWTDALRALYDAGYRKVDNP